VSADAVDSGLPDSTPPARLLTVTGVVKSFAGVRALHGVSFDLDHGEVHGLIGENGAGKSTLIRIISGAEMPDAGTVEIGGHALRRLDPATARAFGIAAIHQHPALFAHLTVAENIALAVDGGQIFRRVDWRARRARASDLLARIGASIAPDRRVGTLSLPDQQLLEIAKALGLDANVLIMDEPSASLTGREVDRLFEVIGRLRAEGKGIVYVSHRLEEICALADRVTVLRDGETVATLPRAQVTPPELIRLMVGRPLSAVFPKRPVTAGAVALELRRVSSRAAGIRDVSLTVRRGEILGMAGLVGAGRTPLAEMLFGLAPIDSGRVLLEGESVRLGSPADAIDRGIAYVPEDRRQHGIVLQMPIAANTTLAKLSAVSRRGLIDRRAEAAHAQAYVDRLRIKTTSVDDDADSLSGGNQQKVALARWLSTKPKVLILDEPTQGIDVGSKAEIHALMQELAEQGTAIIMISSELTEILGMADRIVVMRGGTVGGTLSRADATAPAIMTIAVGV
jgi:rhamnose transport system ATP-binding protein